MNPPVKNILITGGSGLIGRELTNLLLRKGYKVSYLSRNPEKIQKIPAYKWDIASEYIDPQALENTDVIVHLAGENITEGRWTKQRKELIYQSRVQGAKLLLSKVLLYKAPLKAFISSSAIGYYGTFTSDEIFTEDYPSGEDFLAQVADAWESAAWEFYKNGFRVGIVRTGVVLSPDGGLIKKIYPLARLGLLSVLGTGKQYVPWIHIKDLARIYLMLIESDISDVFNGVAPEHVTYEQLVRTFARLLGKRIWLPRVPEFVVRMMFGEMSSIMIYGSRVSAQKLLKTGFEFLFPRLEDALKDIVQKLKD